MYLNISVSENSFLIISNAIHTCLPLTRIACA